MDAPRTEALAPGVGTAVRLCLASRVPMLLAVGGGPQLVYNEALGLLLEQAGETMPQLWSRLHPVIEAVHQSGAALPPLPVLPGHAVTFNCSPLLADDGVTVEAVMCICIEAADDALALQRLQGQVTRVARATTLAQLAASITHEVSQPLAAASASAGACLRWLAADPPAIDEAIAAARHVVRDTERAGAVVRQTRSFLQPGSAEAEVVQLPAVAADVIAIAVGELHQRKADVTLTAPPDLPAVRVDRVQLQQVLLNLLLNAMDAVRGVGEGNRGIAIEMAVNAAGEVEVAVKDHGRGMGARQLQRIFEPFYTTKPSGIGMGLTLSRKIVEAHHGRLWAESEPQGATFRFTLPTAGATPSAG